MPTDHPIFSKDPKTLSSYVYCKVKVTSEGLEHIGWVYTIDPVSETIVIVQRPRKVLIFPAASAHLEKLDTNVTPEVRTWLDNLLGDETETVTLSEEDLQVRQLVVQEWLKKNHLPVEIRGKSLAMGEVLFINPPYNSDQCFSTNQIVLDRIRSILKAMPS